MGLMMLVHFRVFEDLIYRLSGAAVYSLRYPKKKYLEELSQIKHNVYTCNFLILDKC